MSKEGELNFKMSAFIKYDSGRETRRLEVYSDSDYDFDEHGRHGLKERCKLYEQDEPFTISWIKSFSKNSVFR